MLAFWVRKNQFPGESFVITPDNLNLYKLLPLKIFNSIADFSSSRRTIVTLGTFDGVHIGHAGIIEQMKRAAVETGCETLLLTFFPHPRMVLQDYSGIKLLSTITEKASLLEKAGLQNLVVHAFDKEFSRLSAEDFVREILVKQFNVHTIIIGHDHRFGRNRTANINDLKRFGEQYGFLVEELSPQTIDGVSVSSTKIRNALLEGNIPLANRYLGYSYFLTGKVVKGKQLGRTIGFPTANIEVAEDYKLIPKEGIYVVCSHIGERNVYGMMSIGTNPTVGGEARTLEVYYFDLNRDLYGVLLSVSFLAYIREEEKFGSIELLKNALERDRDFSLKFIHNL